MKTFFQLFLTELLLCTFNADAQSKGSLDIKLNRYFFQPGDTVKVNATYSEKGASNYPPATLQVVIENTEGNRTRLRWPLLNGKAVGALVMSDSLPRGKYTLYMAVQPRFFEVVGKLADKKPSGMLNAMLLTRNGSWDTQEIPVQPDGTFTVNNWLFQDNGLIAFSNTGKNSNNNNLNIRISTKLDSTYEPVAIAAREIYFGTPGRAQVAIDSLGRNLQLDDARFSDKGELLPAVVVKAKTKSRAEQFSDEYASGLFRSGNERMLDIMSDPSAISFPSVLAYLQGRVAGLQIRYGGAFGGGGAIWRGNPVAFFIDEMRVDAQQLNNIPMNDIAIVKAFPPPFIGAPGGGSGGAIAVYTRRGGENNFLPENRSVFQIKGYTPEVVKLNMNKLNL